MLARSKTCADDADGDEEHRIESFLRNGTKVVLVFVVDAMIVGRLVLIAEMCFVHLHGVWCKTRDKRNAA